MDRFIRITTTGKPLADIDQGIVDAVQRGNRVLVKVGSSLPNRFGRTAERTDSEKVIDRENGAIANWAEGLAQEHGLVWQRVGPDLLFTKLNIPS